MQSRASDYLIIGNSAAGLSAAETIRAAQPKSSILIIGDEPYRGYGRPLISYLIEGKTTEDNIWLREEGFYDSVNISVLTGPDYKAVSLDANAHEATLENGDVIKYKKCLIATGSVPFTPPIDGLDGASNVFGFMKLDDAKALWSAVRNLQQCLVANQRKSRVVVVGAGLIGLKAAEAVAGFVDEVVVLELAPRILPAVLDEQGASVLQTILASGGITCMPGVSAQSFTQLDGKIVSACLTNGETLDCDIVVAAVGVRPNSALALSAGAEQGRGLICDSNMRTTLPDVYAAGDVVQTTDILDGSKRPLALWPNAVQQGTRAGAFMAETTDALPYEGSFAVNAVDFFDASLLTSGVINPSAEDLEQGIYDQKVFLEDKTYAKFVVKDDKLVGYILLNRPDSAGIYTSLIENATPLSSLNEDVFARVPSNTDLTTESRWERLHVGYPEGLDRLGYKKAR